MYLSSLLIDTGENPDRPRPGRLWLRNLYHVHQRLCMAFPSQESLEEDPLFLKPFTPAAFPDVHEPRTEQHAFLFRVDPLPVGRAVILVQSAAKPDWRYAFQNTSLLASPPEVKTYAPKFEAGQHLRFRLAANPTKRLSKASTGPDGKSIRGEWVGKRVPVATDQIEGWLMRQAANNGFSIERLDLVLPGYVYFMKRSNSENENRINRQDTRLHYVRYEGILKVLDLAAFLSVLVHGLGPAKGFGFGLLSVAPVKV